MPTKPNRAGQQQNYVPPGNGDASGEYADEASGSNIHFTNFKKPEEPKVVETPKVEQPKVTLETENTTGKKLTKKEKVTKENEVAFKKAFPNTRVNFSGYTEDAQKNLIDSANHILKDFPNLREHLIEFGNPLAMTKEDKEKAIRKALDEITDEKVNQYREKFKRWNHLSDEQMQKYDFEWCKQQLINQAQNTYVPKRAAIGRACAITCHQAWGSPEKSKIYFRDKFIGKDSKSFADDCFEKNWWSSDDENVVPHHELGHALDNYLFNTFFTRGYRQEIKNLYEEELENIERKKRQFGGRALNYEIKEELKKKGEKLYNLSEYGMTDMDEFIAESVAAHYGKQNNPLAEKVFNIMQRAEKEIQYANTQKAKGL